MPKRFTDSDKWTDPWFRRLSPTMKMFWLYLLDNCDMAGIWDVDIELASYFLGTKLDPQKIDREIDGRVVVIEDGRKWWVPKFIQFQYGELSTQSRVHLKVIQVLDKYGLKYSVDTVSTDCRRGIDTPKDKDKVQVQDKAKDKKEGRPENLDAVRSFFAELRLSSEAEAFYDHFEANGWKQGGRSAMKDWRAAARNWVRNSVARFGKKLDPLEKKESGPPPTEVCGNCGAVKLVGAVCYDCAAQRKGA